MDKDDDKSILTLGKGKTRISHYFVKSCPVCSFVILG